MNKASAQDRRFRRDSRPAAVAYAEVWNVRARSTEKVESLVEKVETTPDDVYELRDRTRNDCYGGAYALLSSDAEIVELGVVPFARR